MHLCICQHQRTGCVIAAWKDSADRLWSSGKTDWRPELEEIRQDFTDSAIDGILSENIRREALEKFSYVSPIGAAGLYCNAVAGDFQKEGAPRELFCSMIREIAALADAMGVPFQKDMVDVNLHILSNLAPETTTSMQRDVMAGKPSEIDGLVYEVVRMGKLYGVPVPSYTKVANRLAEKKGSFLIWMVFWSIRNRCIFGVGRKC